MGFFCSERCGNCADKYAPRVTNKDLDDVKIHMENCDIAMAELKTIEADLEIFTQDFANFKARMRHKMDALNEKEKRDITDAEKSVQKEDISSKPK